MDEVVREALDAIAAKDWEVVKLALHPYMHWTSANGQRMRGRHNVMLMLLDSPSVAPPSSYELRDGQIYRWFV